MHPVTRPPMPTRQRSGIRGAAALAAAALLAACATATPLPEAGSPAARLYAQRCGACHAVPHPKRLDFARWQATLKLMEERMAQRGLPPLSPEERRTLLAYLRRNAR
ncbi:MAG: cytochrome C [Gammaproteobacteria bacterium]|nr:MAG: cytochrome C [Gammaproteobacteria bacterium]